MPRKPSDALRKLTDKILERVRRFTKQTDEVLEEPIDFSAPSIPYYENLANRMSFTRVVLYMVLLVFVVVTVICNHRLITYENLYYLAKDIGAATVTAQSQAERISYPVSSSESDFALYRGGMVVAGGEVVTAVSGSGRQTMSANVAYAEPCVRASEKYFLTFGRGEKSFSVYNSFVRVHRELTEFPVYDGAVGDNGNFAVVTRSRNYQSEVVIYDGDMEKIANYHLNGYVTGLAMNREGDRLGVVSVESVNGLWETKVTIIRIEKRINQSSVTLSGMLGSACGFADDERLAVIFGDRLMIWDDEATVKGEARFEGATPALCAISRGRVAVLADRADDLSSRTLWVFDKNGRQVYDLAIGADHAISRSGETYELAFGGESLFVRTRDKLYRLSADGEELSSAAVGYDTLTMLPTGPDEVLVCTPAYAAWMGADDFTEE